MIKHGLFLALFLLICAIITAKPSVVCYDSLQTVESIETHRKGDVILTCFNETGSLLPDCEIRFAQVSHDFLFAAHPMGKFNQYDPRYANLLKEAGINFSYILPTWGSIEPEPGQFEWGAIESYQDVQAQLAQGFKLMGGLTLWWYRGSGLGDQFCPLYLDSMDFEELKAATYNHMYALAMQYREIIDIWEFNEQNSSWTNPLDLTWRQKLEICQSATSGIRDAQPEAKILYTSNALPDEFGWPSLVNIDGKANGVQFPTFLHMLTDYGILFDIVGLEFYYSGKNADGYIPPMLDIDDLSDLIDLYSSFGKPIFIRELSAPSEQVEGTSMWNGPWNEETQADYLRQVYTMAFGKALVKAIGWAYGVSDEDSYIISGGILDDNLNPKSSYYSLKDLIGAWTTSGNCITDEKGECRFRGFAGDYNVTISPPSGRSWQTIVHIYEQQQTSVIVAPILVDIKANSQDDPIIVTPTDPVSIKINLAPGVYAGANADWWIAVKTPFAPPGDWYTYVCPSGWWPGINLCIQTPLFALSPYELLNMTLPVGNYTFYFAINDPDGAATGPWWGLDSVEVTVQ